MGEAILKIVGYQVLAVNEKLKERIGLKNEEW
jgi:hypothetical protein